MIRLTRFSALYLSASLLGDLPAFAATPIVDEFSADTSTNYNTPTGRSPFTHDGVSGGINGNPGRLNTSTANAGNNVRIHQAAVGTFDADTAFTASIYLHVAAVSTTLTSTLTLGAVSIGDNNNAQYTTAGNSPSSLHVDLRRGFGTANSQYGFRFKSDDSNTGEQFSGGKVTLVANTWYQLELTVVQTAPTQFSVTGGLRDWGANGVTGGNSILSHTVSFTNAGLLGSENIFAAFYARNESGNTSRVDYVDNLVVIPEPSTMVTLLGGLGLLLLRRSRRRA